MWDNLLISPINWHEGSMKNRYFLAMDFAKFATMVLVRWDLAFLSFTSEELGNDEVLVKLEHNLVVRMYCFL